MKVYLDIGANSGESMLHHAGDDAIVYAFEPTPKLVDILTEKTKDIKNYHIIDKAVADYNGKSTFFISGVGDWGCSSLNTYNDNLDKTWPGRTGFEVTDQVQVDVIRLDDFIVEKNIREIEFFKCSAQGKDMDILLGMGAHLMRIKQGQILMPINHDTKLYKDSKYISRDAIRLLQRRGFRVDKTLYNDNHHNEEHILFSRIGDLPEIKPYVPKIRIGAPRLKNNTGKPRVAVVFSGRATCYDESYDWFMNFSDNYDVDFYCSISTDLDDYYQKFIDLYKIENYEFGNKPPCTYFSGDPNISSMFYNLQSAVEMIPLDDYDIILYSRSDIVCSQDIDLTVAMHHPDGDNVVFIPDDFDYTGINDQMAFGTPAAMIKYSRVFDNIDEYMSRGDLTVGDRPERVLDVHINIAGLKVERFDLEYALNPRRREIDLSDTKIDVPKIKTNHEELRVAVIFSGRATCYDDSYAWFNKFIDRYVVDFYCSISTELDEYYQKFIDLYKIKKYTFENIPTGVVFTNHNHRNRLSMFYNLKSAVDLVPLGDYDIILYARADIVCSQDIDLSVAIDRNNTVFIPNGNDSFGVNDQLAFGTPETMFKYSRVFDNVDKYNRADHLAAVHPERTLKAHIDAVGLSVERFDLNYSLNPKRYDYENEKRLV